MELVNLAMKIKEETPVAISKSEESSISYPYGLEVNLESDTLERLGLSAGNFTVGDIVDIVAKAKVSGVSINQYGDGEKSQSVRIQITDISINGQAEGFEDSFNEAIKKDKKIYPDLELQTPGGFKKSLYEATR